ncbi:MULTISPECIES: 4'-phosphopantetheinyl transferase family protein [unclassified Janthinobacterium]|uniref:4'-phosphopantetheinyl transferase family protein n=1 Tax=unclassified Janthinobacterium TaxID=2610881 RepID=UPI0003490E41|nr:MULTISPECIES: 4'-phosphopantetheinyl transferase superfamily protein [unclassified Janthinobacterium]MEC5163280.1 4'-phosphopantetheinyl transferase [Janthinobacterium sp. CG_S6]
MAGARASVWLLRHGDLGEAELAACRAALSAGEALRERRFVRPERRSQFLAGRALLRQAIGQLVGVPAATVLLSERRGQAPLAALAGASLPVPFFSLSHSGPWVACAVSADTALGLDIEVLDPAREVLALARQAFDAAAVAALAQLPEVERAARFYQLWSEREARYKLGACAAPVCVSLPHAELSVVLCSARALAGTPPLRLIKPAASPRGRAFSPWREVV